MDWADAFVAAFNRRDLAALAGLVATDAVARVDGAPFPEERGREVIRDTSLAYVLGEDLALHARPTEHPDVEVLLLDADGRLDMALAVEHADGLARSIVYYTTPHRREVMSDIANALGLSLAEDA